MRLGPLAYHWVLQRESTSAFIRANTAKMPKNSPGTIASTVPNQGSFLFVAMVGSAFISAKVLSKKLMSFADVRRLCFEWGHVKLLNLHQSQ